MLDAHATRTLAVWRWFCAAVNAMRRLQRLDPALWPAIARIRHGQRVKRAARLRAERTAHP